MESILDRLKDKKLDTSTSNKRKLYIESYGCAMNFSDSEIIASIMADSGFQTTEDEMDADLVLLNTCAIR
ncbi:MAG: tRNA (N6-isopentenyl adenosine(37)-C2)-methylthiotransferase MiaB, partial [Bacteroidia bacterium]|nr:tRNA (N6-isopentenyl adenosine(37)-C2)-methylthiotransferase MiaB [Bacteroidia bacterium]